VNIYLVQYIAELWLQWLALTSAGDVTRHIAVHKRHTSRSNDRRKGCTYLSGGCLPAVPDHDGATQHVWYLTSVMVYYEMNERRFDSCKRPLHWSSITDVVYMQHWHEDIRSLSSAALAHAHAVRTDNNRDHPEQRCGAPD